MYSPAKSRPSRGVLGLLLSPAIIAVAQAQALAAWASSQALEALLLPKRAAVACLYIANVGSGDLLAYLTAQPTSKMQLERQQQALVLAQQKLASQQRLVEDLQREVDMLRADRRKLHRRNVELSARAQQAEAEAEALAAAAAAAGARAGAGGGGAPEAAAAVKLGVGGGAGAGAGAWGLHTVVAAAAVAIRWWLLNETDPVQRKIMLVILWPASWVYGSMLLGCLPPNSPRLRRFFTCLGLLILGYVARCAAERTLGLSAAAAGGAPPPRAPLSPPRWAGGDEWGAGLGGHHRGNHGAVHAASAAAGGML